MKKIITSISVIAIAAVVVVGATIAFFNDTETSTGNIFTAGSIDLKVDQTMASYNGEQCQTCSLAIVSDSTTLVGSSPAVVLSVVHPAWTADLDGGHVAGMPNDGSNDGSKWVWITDGPTQPTTDQDYTFNRSFVWNGTASAATLYIATDNLYTSIKLNNVLIGSTANDNNFQLATEDVFINLAPYLVQGNNLLQVTVRNIGLGGSTPTSNPAGLLFKLKIEGSCAGGSAYQNTPGATCELWGPQNLTSQQYFNFGDVKPGDHGRNLISLRVDDNDAYACLIPNNIHNDENVVVDPEVTAGDTSADGLENGELGNELEFFLWEDNGDGAYQVSENILVGAGATLAQIQIQMIALQLTGNGPTEYVGLAWCAGDQSLSGSNILCDGAGMGDIAQTDKLLASLTAYAEQIRNNPNFSCGNVNLPDQDEEGNNGGSLGPAPVNLLSANGFVIVAKAGITDATPAGSVITGDVAVNPIAGSAITGVSCSTVNGTIYSSGGYTGGFDSDTTCAVTNPVTALAVRLAMETAYADAAGRTGPDGTNLYAGNLGGQTFAPGLYKWTTGVTIPTDVTLSGDANDVWIFQISGTLDIASGGSPSGGADVVLIGGAQAKNVFWQVTGATTLGTYSTFNGTILDATNIAIQKGAGLSGRALAQTAVTLDDNTVTLP